MVFLVNLWVSITCVQLLKCPFLIFLKDGFGQVFSSFSDFTFFKPSFHAMRLCHFLKKFVPLFCCSTVSLLVGPLFHFVVIFVELFYTRVAFGFFHLLCFLRWCEWGCWVFGAFNVPPRFLLLSLSLLATVYCSSWVLCSFLIPLSVMILFVWDELIWGALGFLSWLFWKKCFCMFRCWSVFA